MSVIYNGWKIYENYPPHHDRYAGCKYWIHTRSKKEFTVGKFWINASFLSLFDAMQYVAMNLEEFNSEES